MSTHLAASVVSWNEVPVWGDAEANPVEGVGGVVEEVEKRRRRLVRSLQGGSTLLQAIPAPPSLDPPPRPPSRAAPAADPRSQAPQAADLGVRASASGGGGGGDARTTPAPVSEMQMPGCL